MPNRQIEFWFEYGSTYTYLTVARIVSLARARNVAIEWRPFLLMPVLTEQGMPNGPFLPYPNKMRYMWRDLERRASRHGIPYQRPSVYPPNTLLTARIGFLAQGGDWCGAFTQEVFRLHWTEGTVIGTDENIRRSLSLVGKRRWSYVGGSPSRSEQRWAYALKLNTPKPSEFLARLPSLLATSCFGAMTDLKRL
jgi:2-hydroxychromene-2-carboxylate isomerase